MLFAAVASVSAAAQIDFSKIRTVAGSGDNQVAVVLRWNATDGNMENLVWGVRYSGDITAEQALREAIKGDNRLFGLSVNDNLEGIGFLLYTKKSLSCVLKTDGTSNLLYSGGKPKNEDHVLNLTTPYSGASVTTGGVVFRTSGGSTPAGNWRYFISSDSGETYRASAAGAALAGGDVIFIEYSMSDAMTEPQYYFYVPQLTELGFFFPERIPATAYAAVKIPYYINLYANTAGVSFTGTNSRFGISSGAWSCTGWSTNDIFNATGSGGQMYVNFTPNAEANLTPEFNFNFKNGAFTSTSTVEVVAEKVTTAMTGLSFPVSSIELWPEESCNIRAIVAPQTPEALAEQIDYTIESASLSNPGSYNAASGILTAGLRAGTFTLTASNHKNPTIRASVNVEVKAPSPALSSVSFSPQTITVRNGESTDLAQYLIFSPSDTPYKGMNYSSSATATASVDADGILTAKGIGEATITATYRYNTVIKTQLTVKVIPAKSVERIAFEEYEPGNEIRLPYMDILKLQPKVYPEDADMRDFSVEIGNPDIATTYNVPSLDGYFLSEYPELVTHATGTTTLKFVAADGSGVESPVYRLVVEDSDRTPISEDMFADGFYWLNEEWFTHTNGSVNFVDGDFNVHYRVYESQNPYQSFGATSQYATIYGGKMIVMSKQDRDKGDTRPGGGRTVIADARTMKRLASFTTIGGDGRACAGVSPEKAYLGTTSGVVPVSLADYTLGTPVKLYEGDEYSPDALYKNQTGDMAVSGNRLFVIQQNVGMHVIDTETDKLEDTYQCTPQGIVTGCDGDIWLAADGKLLRFDPQTLSVKETVAGVPVYCDWSTWRSTNFIASKKENVLWWIGGGVITKYNVDEGTRTKVCSIADLLSEKQYVGTSAIPRSESVYGTFGLDEERGLLLVASVLTGSSLYRNVWYNFIDATSGQLVRKVHLKPYYWFPAIPVIPDRHDPEINIESIDVDIDKGVKEIDLSEYVTDRDDRDSQIRLAIAPAPARSAAVADVTLNGHTLTINPLSSGVGNYILTAESNGRTVSAPLSINVGTAVGIHEIADYSEAGVSVRGFYTPEGIFAGSERKNLAPGVYVMLLSNGKSKRILVKE